MNLLENARPENCFYCADGSVLCNAKELEKKLKTISAQAYRHHVNEQRNDFHNWIRDVYHDNELAGELLKAKSPAAAAAAIKTRILKALKAREEIERAIEKAKKTPIKKTAAIAKKARPKKIPAKQRQKTAHASKAKAGVKKRKVNKKIKPVKRTKRNRKKAAANKNRRGKRGKINRQMKKGVHKWLNWLKIIPEL